MDGVLDAIYQITASSNLTAAVSIAGSVSGSADGPGANATFGLAYTWGEMAA